MAGDNYYLLSALPGLGELGVEPPLSPAQLLGQMTDDSASMLLLQTLFLSDDLLQRQAFLSGEIEQLKLSVLAEGQGRSEEPLPVYLAVGQENSSDSANLDQVWQRYYRYAHGIANQEHSRFLTDWVGFEVALRNELVRARAKSLKLDPEEYLVAVDLADDTLDLARVINDWSSAADPLAGLKVLDGYRWEWLLENEQWFSYSNDELVVYGARLMLLRRWKRLNKASMPEKK